MLVNSAPSNARARRAGGDTANRPRPETPILITAASAVGSVLTLTFDQPVILSGVPQFTTDMPATPVSATRPATNQVAITYSAGVAGLNLINLAFRDPAIRNASGGYVTCNTYIL
jgi:hypothetical protein